MRSFKNTMVTILVVKVLIIVTLFVAYNQYAKYKHNKENKEILLKTKKVYNSTTGKVCEVFLK